MTTEIYSPFVREKKWTKSISYFSINFEIRSHKHIDSLYAYWICLMVQNYDWAIEARIRFQYVRFLVRISIKFASENGMDDIFFSFIRRMVECINKIFETNIHVRCCMHACPQIYVFFRWYVCAASIDFLIEHVDLLI